MAKRRAESGEEKGNWLDTYADMVTLLLCFFVLLYSASSVDETKWQYIYQSFTSSGSYINPFVMDEQPKNNAADTNGNAEAPPNTQNGGTTSEQTEGLPSDFNQLYSFLKTTTDKNDLGQYVYIEQTPTRIFIRFNNTIMFDGNSAVLKEEGKQVLNKFMPGIKAVNKYIKSCSVSGHTAKAVSDVNDWDLSAARASSVVKYMDYNRCVDSEKFTVEGKACYTPIADNSTAEGRAANRRVEIMIVRAQLDTTSQAVIDDILKYEYRLNGANTDPYERNNSNSSDVNSDVVNEIIDNMESKYDSNPGDGNNSTNAAGPKYEPSYTGTDRNVKIRENRKGGEFLADTLTQEQIDAMLSSVLSGGDTASLDTHEEKEEIKEYDFRTPKKFTKEQIKILERIFENYSRHLSSYITGLLRLYCKVSLASIEEQKYFEFSNALPDYTIMGIVDLGIEDDDIEESNAVLQLSNSLTFTMIDRMLGGRGTYQDTDRDFTEIEINVMRGIVERFTSLMSQAWDGYVDTNPKLESIETNSRVISAADADETMIIVAMEVTVNDSKSIVSFCMSAITMDQIMKKFSAKFSSGKRAGSPTKETERKENLMSTLSQSELTVTAVLDDTMLTLRDVLNLQVNDIIPLNKPITDNVQLKVGSTCWFDGKLGTLNGKKAFRIDNILKN